MVIVDDSLQYLKKRRSWQEKIFFYGGQKCWRETIQSRFISSDIEYYVLSQPTYNCLRQDFQPPTISTITKITSKVKTVVQSFLVH